MKKNPSVFFSFLLLMFILLSMFSCNDSSADKTMLNAKEGVQFENTGLDIALQKSQAQQKPIFLFAHAPYCSVCKKMKRTVFPEKKVGDFFNNKFINVQMDVDSKEGEIVAAKFNIDHTPAFIFLSPAGKLISKTSGFESSEELITLASSIK
ncbi:MAG: thioredoxin family protein [Ferruginibacter sp.]